MVKTKPLKSSGHKLLKQSVGFIRSNWRLLGGVVLVAVIIYLAIGLLSTGEANTLYKGMWFVFVSTSLIWTLRHSQPNTKHRPSVNQAYWTGSASALKLLIILSLIALLSLPFSIGAFIFSTVNFLAVDSVTADLIASGVWLAFGFLTLVLLARLLMALIIASLPNIIPWRAITLSWQLTRGRTLAVSRRLVVVIAYSLILVLALSLLLSSLPIPLWLVQVKIDLLIFGVIVPFFYVYLWLLYQELQ